MTRSIAVAILLSASVSLATPSIAEAQLGGLIKKKVKEAIVKPSPTKTDEPTASSAQPAAASAKNNDPTGFGSAIIEITQPTFDALMRGMQMEIGLQSVLKKEIARYGTRDQYEACKIKVGTSPEGVKVMSAMYNPPKNVTAEQYMKIQAKVVEDMDAMTNKACPLNPSFWDATRVGQSLDSIHDKVAESEKLDPQLYSVALERIARLCEYKGFGEGATAVDTLNKKDAPRDPHAGAPLKIAGEGKDIYWLWTAGETVVVNAANCRRYNALAKQLMK